MGVLLVEFIFFFFFCIVRMVLVAVVVVAMARSKRVRRGEQCSLPHVIQRMRSIEADIKRVLDEKGYTALSFKRRTIEELKQLDYGDVLLYFACQKPGECERSIKIDIIKQHSTFIGKVDQQTHTFGQSLMQLLKNDEHSAWYFFWSLFQCNELLDNKIWSTNYFDYFSKLWLSDTPRFVLSALIMLHHCSATNDHWAQPLIMMLLLPFHRSNVKQCLLAPRTDLTAYSFKNSLLDHFYLRFNGGSMEHVRGSFGCDYTCSTTGI